MTVTAARDPLTVEQRAVLAAVFTDALDYREPAGDCADCASHPYGLCPDHAADRDRCDDYITLAVELGIEAP